MKNLKSGILFLLLLNMSNSVDAAEIFRNFTSNRFDAHFEVNYFKTEANFASNGSQQSLPSGYSFQVIDTAVSARYVLLDDLGLHAGMNIGSSEAVDLLATRRNSTLNYVDLGADYLFFRSRQFSLYADLTYRHAVEKVATDIDSSLNGDGASEVHARVTTLFDVGYMQPYLSGGVNYRTEGLSTLLMYTLGLRSTVGHFGFGAALNGYISAIDDSKTNTPAERELVTNRVNATSKKFYAVNPNLLDADLYLKYMFSRNFAIHVNAGHTITGSNTAIGLHAGAGITWGFGGDHYENYSKPGSSFSPTSTPSAPNKPGGTDRTQTPQPVKKFQEDTSDGVNQDYFKPVTPAQDPYFDKIQDVPPATDEEEFQINSKKAPPSSGGEDGEYKVKLKKAKKKKSN